MFLYTKPTKSIGSSVYVYYNHTKKQATLNNINMLNKNIKNIYSYIMFPI